MSTGDFLLKSVVADEVGNAPAVALGYIPSVTVNELEGVLEVIDEEIVLVERSSGNILWMSSTCREISHKLGSSANLDEFPSLQRMINEALPRESGVKLKSRWHTRDGQWQQYIGDERTCTVSVLVRPENADHIWVRFYRSNEQEEYIRQSLADHEKLFSTSRALSVSEMVTTLAHELNQPLGTLVNIVNGIRSRLDASSQGSEELFEALELAQKQGQFASDILLRLRDFAEAKQPVIEQCNVSELISNTLELLDWVFVAQQVNVNFNISEPDILLAGDVTLLQQVLVNLLRNAVDAMEQELDEKRIDITVRNQKKMVYIAISDTGHGISKESQDSLFTPFKSKKANGMGVGLNICRSFIELHQGKFWFTQNKVKGCTANILIPNGIKK